MAILARYPWLIRDPIPMAHSFSSQPPSKTANTWRRQFCVVFSHNTTLYVSQGPTHWRKGLKTIRISIERLQIQTLHGFYNQN